MQHVTMGVVSSVLAAVSVIYRLFTSASTRITTTYDVWKLGSIHALGFTPKVWHRVDKQTWPCVLLKSTVHHRLNL